MYHYFACMSNLQGGNSLVLPTAGPTSLVTQAAEGTQSSIPLTQQPLPVFRHPTGMPIPHYHPNYIPYGHYFSPFYVPPPSIHQFLSNGAFPQQPQAGSIYPAPPGATAKYSLPQYKAGNNTGNPAHIAMAGNYGYGSSPTGYNPSSTPTSGNSTANEDLATPQFKENNVYMTGQQVGFILHHEIRLIIFVWYPKLLVFRVFWNMFTIVLWLDLMMIE